MQHNEAYLGRHFGLKACLDGSLAQQIVHFHQRFPNEGHPAILGGQRFEDVGVKNKSAMHFVAIFEGVEQCSIVCNA